MGRRWWVLCGLMALLAAGCRTAGIKDAYTTRDSGGRLKTDVFYPDHTEMHVFIEFVSGREDAILYVDLDPPQENIRVESDEIAPGKGYHDVDVPVYAEDAEGKKSAEGPWPLGDYYADIYIDDIYDRTVTFYVEE